MNRLLRFVFIVLFPMAAWAADHEYVAYRDFLSSADSGKISEVRFVDLSGIEWSETGRNEKVFTSYAPIRPADDPLLRQYLENRKIKISGSTVSIAPKPMLSYGYSTFDLLWFIIWVQAAMFVFLFVKLRRPKARQEVGPNKAAEPTRATVTPPAGAGDRASGARGSS